MKDTKKKRTHAKKSSRQRHYSTDSDFSSASSDSHSSRSGYSSNSHGSPWSRKHLKALPKVKNIDSWSGDNSSSSLHMSSSSRFTQDKHHSFERCRNISDRSLSTFSPSRWRLRPDSFSPHCKRSEKRRMESRSPSSSALCRKRERKEKEQKEYTKEHRSHLVSKFSSSSPSYHHHRGRRKFSYRSSSSSSPPAAKPKF